jgi:hypothetical protein
MIDPALGRDRATRALGEFAQGTDHPVGRKPMKKTRSKVMNVKNENIRQINNGQFSGVRPTYGRYNVSEQSKDILNRSLRTMNKEY